MALPLTITDRPRFTHRGLLVDTGRNYHAVSQLKRALEVRGATGGRGWCCLIARAVPTRPRARTAPYALVVVVVVVVGDLGARAGNQAGHL